MLNNEKEIKMFIHCGKCIEEVKKKDGVSPRDYERIEVGWTKNGIQLWCIRHECNIMNMDFEGSKHPANCTRKEDDEEGGKQ